MITANMVPNSAGDDGQSNLGDPALLDKIDELRRLNITSMVPLPQVRYSHTFFHMYVPDI